MKGWHKHGICSEQDGLTCRRRRRRPHGCAHHRPLRGRSAPFPREPHRHRRDALGDRGGGRAHATSMVHKGWTIRIRRRDRVLARRHGRHAFAIVAYDNGGFWIQNSWGPSWGKNGYGRFRTTTGSPTARISGRAARRPRHAHPDAIGRFHACIERGRIDRYSYADLRPHVVSSATTACSSPAATMERRNGSAADLPGAHAGGDGAVESRKHILLYAHGGLVPESNGRAAARRLPGALLDAQVYPITFIWHSDYWTTITNVRATRSASGAPRACSTRARTSCSTSGRRPSAVARLFSGKGAWDEMKDNALAAAVQHEGRRRYALNELRRYIDANEDVSVHVVGHSAGSIFHAPVVTTWPRRDCHRKLHAVGSGVHGRPVQGALSPAAAEQRHQALRALCAHRQGGAGRRLRGHLQQEPPLSRPNAFEEEPHIPLARDGVPVLGMQKFHRRRRGPHAVLFRRRGAELVHAPIPSPQQHASSAAVITAISDDDRATVISTLARILGKQAAETAPELDFHAARRGCDSAGDTRQGSRQKALALQNKSVVRQQRPRSHVRDGGSPCSSSSCLCRGRMPGCQWSMTLRARAPPSAGHRERCRRAMPRACGGNPASTTGGAHMLTRDRAAWTSSYTLSGTSTTPVSKRRRSCRSRFRIPCITTGRRLPGHAATASSWITSSAHSATSGGGLQNEVRNFSGIFAPPSLPGLRLAPSTHSWGIAIDLEAERYPWAAASAFRNRGGHLQSAGSSTAATFWPARIPCTSSFCERY